MVKKEQYSHLKSRQIPLFPPFSKGEEIESIISFQVKTSPPFEKGRSGGISGPPEADQTAKLLRKKGLFSRGVLVFLIRKTAGQ